jgi:hypothetical protein
MEESPIPTVQPQPRSNLDPKIDLTRNDMVSVIMGHSFVRNLGLDIADTISKNWGLTSKEKELRCEDIGINPFLHGVKGANIDSFEELILKSKKLNPSIIIIDLGSNDLCYLSCKPTELARKMVAKAKELYNIYRDLGLVVLCHITQKLYMWEGKGDKDINLFNTHAVRYNEKITELVRHEIGLMKWTHRGVFHISDKHTGDGTHLNTKEGKSKYKHSIINLLRSSKKEWILRRGETAREAVNRRNRQKKRKEWARLERRAMEAEEQQSGETSPYYSCQDNTYHPWSNFTEDYEQYYSDPSPTYNDSYQSNINYNYNLPPISYSYQDSYHEQCQPTVPSYYDYGNQHYDYRNQYYVQPFDSCGYYSYY